MARINSSDAMMDILLQYGVEYVYGIPGATEMRFMDALEKTPQIKYVLGLNEVVCIGMAVGYAKAKRRPAFMNLHTGPGMAASMALLADAKVGKVPIVITVGQNDSRLLASDPQLSGNILGMAKTVTKWSTEVTTPEDLPRIMHRAFKTAMQSPSGPVVVSIPQNMMNQEIEYDPRPAQIPFTAMRADKAALEKAVEMIKAAKNPVLMVQEGVARAHALKETVRFAETIGSRVYQVWMADVNFPVQHPLYFGDIDTTSPAMKAMLESADLLIGVGCPMFNDAFHTGIKVMPEGLKVIQIDDDPWEISKNFPADCGIQGDPKSILAELSDMLRDDSALAAAAKERIAQAKIITDAKKAELDALVEKEKDHSPIAISYLMDVLRKNMPENALLVDDCWSSSKLLRAMLDIKDEDTFFRTRNGGSIGCGLPCALGVQEAHPDRPVICISGDGSAAWSMQSFWTAAHENLPVVYIITNNGTYRQVKTVRKIILGDYPLNEEHVGLEINDPLIDFCALAKSMGVDGCQVRKPEELPAALKKGLAGGKPYVIEVFVENNPS